MGVHAYILVEIVASGFWCDASLGRRQGRHGGCNEDQNPCGKAHRCSLTGEMNDGKSIRAHVSLWRNRDGRNIAVERCKRFSLGEEWKRLAVMCWCGSWSRSLLSSFCRYSREPYLLYELL